MREIGEESDGLMRLPATVAFRVQAGDRSDGPVPVRLRDHRGSGGRGPGIVVMSTADEPETVRYPLVNALLLNEVQKRRRTAVRRRNQSGRQKAEKEGLKARLTKLEVRLFSGFHRLGRGWWLDSN